MYPQSMFYEKIKYQNFSDEFFFFFSLLKKNLFIAWASFHNEHKAHVRQVIL